MKKIEILIGFILLIAIILLIMSLLIRNSQLLTSVSFVLIAITCHKISNHKPGVIK